MVKVKCEFCKKSKDEHNAKTLACPIGQKHRVLGYTQYNKTNVYTPKFRHYWMCWSCADKMGGKFPEGHVCTVTSGKCLYCETEDVTLIPYVDFDWKDIKTEHLRD